MLCLSGFELYSRWVPLTIDRNRKNKDLFEDRAVSWCAHHLGGVKEKFSCKELAVLLDATFREQANNTVSKSWLRP